MADDIRYGDGITISVGVAAVLVDLIGLAEKLLGRQNGQPLPTKLRDIRDDLSTCITRAAANADVSTKAVLAESVLAFDKSPDAAAEILGIKPGSVRSACRAGHIGRKVGDRWLISDEEIEMYRRTSARRRGLT
jgi:Helix-turn-helix domain